MKKYLTLTNLCLIGMCSLVGLGLNDIVNNGLGISIVISIYMVIIFLLIKDDEH